ncbi:hypothetical protein EU805_04455 [Salipiger sp. IMCC34102]|uniref:hypothetical protein n=1 Tax=Salipiger sp. IMCC34102 TaxID=2510647 RepID=UPI00101C7662|nr:hypothetical protein [Salipiger sp. IMCC34102]RYH02996.1 hypothetical protein EU805_04455 [Salipiger sp. IMCC34102]
MSPEATLLIVNAAFLGFAYLLAYPLLRVRDPWRLAFYDLFVTGAALLVAGLLYAGSGTRFSLILFDVGWFPFALLTLMLMEIWPMQAYMRRHDIPWPGRDRSDDPD